MINLPEKNVIAEFVNTDQDISGYFRDITTGQCQILTFFVYLLKKPLCIKSLCIYLKSLCVFT